MTDEELRAQAVLLLAAAEHLISIQPNSPEAAWLDREAQEMRRVLTEHGSKERDT